MVNQVAYGFVNLQEVFSRRVTEIGVDVITTAIDATLAEHNRQLNALIDLFATRTTGFKSRYRTPVAQRLQPLDENGRARPVITGAQYDVAWPIQMGGTAHGRTYLAAQKMTVKELNEDLVGLTISDIRWMRDHILAALYDNVGWTFTDDEHGSLSIVGLANGDATLYQIMTGADSQATETHYVAQAAAISNSADPFPSIRDDLHEHPENGGQVLSLIPTNLRATVEALTGFNPIADPNIRPGASSDILTGSLGINVPGEIFGYHDGKVWLSEWRSLPDNYIISVTTEGPRPLAIREDEIASLRGFHRVAERNDHPFYEIQYLRRAGFGSWNRVGARVDRIGTSPYAIPTGYTCPMP